MPVESMAITNREKVKALYSLHIRLKNKAVLVLLSRISWYVSHSCRKRKLSYHIVSLILLHFICNYRVVLFLFLFIALAFELSSNRRSLTLLHIFRRVRLTEIIRSFFINNRLVLLIDPLILAATITRWILRR